MELKTYDSGYLNTYGGGDVKWWQDYIREELDRAHNFYKDQLDDVVIHTVEKVAEFVEMQQPKTQYRNDVMGGAIRGALEYSDYFDLDKI